MTCNLTHLFTECKQNLVVLDVFMLTWATCEKYLDPFIRRVSLKLDFYNDRGTVPVHDEMLRHIVSGGIKQELGGIIVANP